MNLNDRLHTWWMTCVVTTGEEEGDWQRSCTSIRFLFCLRYKDELLLPFMRWLAGIMLDACTNPVCLNVADVPLSFSNFIYLFYSVCDVFWFSRRCPDVVWQCWHFSSTQCMLSSNVMQYSGTAAVFSVTLQVTAPSKSQVSYIWFQKI